MAKRITASVGEGGKNRSEDTLVVKQLINACLGSIPPRKPLTINGNVDSVAIEAISDFQLRVAGMKQPDGRVDPGGRTLRKLNHESKAAMAKINPPNRVALFVCSEKTTRINAMKIGRITVNQKTFDFVSGGGGRGYLPAGVYLVKNERKRKGKTKAGKNMIVDGVGYSFDLLNARGQDRRLDPRMAQPRFKTHKKNTELLEDGEDPNYRTHLRIHPDGGKYRGTAGCIGIQGNGAIQRRFLTEIRVEIEDNGGSFELIVR